MSDAPYSLAAKANGLDWPRLAPAGLAAACFGVLAFALTAQYGFGYEPCELCLYQRFAYGLAGLLALSALLPRLPDGRRDLAVLLTGLVLLGGMGVAFYHVGVEHHWWGSAFCAAGATDLGNLSFQDLRSSLDQPAFKPCDEVDWTFLGLSMATYNVVIFALLGAAALAAYRGRRRRIQP